MIIAILLLKSIKMRVLTLKLIEAFKKSKVEEVWSAVLKAVFPFLLAPSYIQ